MMFGECHAHIIMDGVNYKKAVGIHAEGVREDAIRSHFEEYRKRGITFVRDGGDSYGVSGRAKMLAGEYGIDYRSPIFAIHKQGRYGGIVGRAFADMQEYHKLVLEARSQGADFIKIMTTGIMDFARDGAITGEHLAESEVKEMVHIAHEEGFAVMSHTNGADPVRIALEAGVDSLEHGNFMDEDAIRMLSQSHTVWVPTVVTVKNLKGCGRFPEDSIQKIWERASQNLILAYRYGAKVALGSDAGAYRVFHGQGLVDEFQAFREVLGEEREVMEWLKNGEAEIRSRFCTC
jgi:imidazolonepropionase-like amidohydrolase